MQRWYSQVILTSGLAFSLKIPIEENLLVDSAALVIHIESHEQIQKHRKQRFWVRLSFRSRSQYITIDLIRDLLLNDVDELNLECRCGCGFKIFFRMKSCDFEVLVTKIAHIIKKEDTPFRRSIPANEQLVVLLRFLAAGDPSHSLSYLFKISKQIISSIIPISNTIPIVCDVIISALQDYIKVRETQYVL